MLRWGSRHSQTELNLKPDLNLRNRNLNLNLNLKPKELPSKEDLGYSIYDEFGYMMHHTAE